MRLTDTLAQRKEEFRPMGDEVLLYVCGVTPYAASHIGHAMSYIVFDVLRRYLEYRGYRVRHVQNFTDIDDRLIERANQQGTTVSALSERFIADYFVDMDALNVTRATVYPRATEEIPKIIEMVQGLIEKGFAYVSGGDVFYRVRKKEHYGELKHQSLDELAAGARVEIDEMKEYPADFALWKGAKPGEPAWESPWGPGRPGWHIECSAMSLRYLGPRIDIHGGGEDLIFPHHTNEIAQTEAFTGERPFVNIWMHNAHLRLDGEKMSKSLGNIMSIGDALERWGADGLRLFVLGSHYRSPLTASDDALDAARRGAERLRSAANTVATQTKGGSELDATLYRERFVEAMDDDLNTPRALAALFDLAKEINRARDEGLYFEAAQRELRELTGVLGLTLKESERTMSDVAPFVELLVAVRGELKSAKQYQLADRIRAGLGDLGIALEDGPSGTTWRVSSTN